MLRDQLREGRFGAVSHITAEQIMGRHLIRVTSGGTGKRTTNPFLCRVALFQRLFGIGRIGRIGLIGRMGSGNKMPPSFRQGVHGIPASVQYREQPDFWLPNCIKDAVRKVVQI
jgi:hypothetical protein